MGSGAVFTYLFASFLVYTSRFTYLLLPEYTRSVSRQEVVGGDQTWL